MKIGKSEQDGPEIRSSTYTSHAESVSMGRTGDGASGFGEELLVHTPFVPLLGRRGRSSVLGFISFCV